MSGKWIPDSLLRDYKDVKPYAWENVTFIINTVRELMWFVNEYMKQQKTEQ